MKESTQALALEVKYFGPTNSRGSRIQVKCRRLEKSKMISFDYSARSTYEQIQQELAAAGIECESLLDMCGHYILVIDWQYREALEKFFGGAK